MTSDDRVALVTGAARGQGAAIVRKLREDGFLVGACDVRMNELQSSIADLGDGVIAVERAGLGLDPSHTPAPVVAGEGAPGASDDLVRSARATGAGDVGVTCRGEGHGVRARLHREAQGAVTVVRVAVVQHAADVDQHRRGRRALEMPEGHRSDTGDADVEPVHLAVVVEMGDEGGPPHVPPVGAGPGVVPVPGGVDGDPPLGRPETRERDGPRHDRRHEQQRAAAVERRVGAGVPVQVQDDPHVVAAGFRPGFKWVIFISAVSFADGCIAGEHSGGGSAGG